MLAAKAMFSLTFGPAFPDMDIGDGSTDCWSVFTFLPRPGLAWRFLLPKQDYRDTAQAYLVPEANKQGRRADVEEGYQP